MYFCPSSTRFYWELSPTTSHQIVAAFTAISCPAIIILNTLVILAVKTRQGLKKKSLIALSSLAVTDLLVGTISMPLTVTSDMFILEENLVEDTFCIIDAADKFFVYITFCASFFHLLLIAWERYVAVHKWNEYNATVTNVRINKYIAVAWMATLITVVPKGLMTGIGAPWPAILIFDIVIGGVFFICLLQIAYFYAMAYRGVRRWNRSQIRQVNAVIKSKNETNVAFTTLWITIFTGLSIVPSFAVFVFGTVEPSLRTNSFFRWSEILLHLNSLVNPLLYCYRDRRFRRAVLELLRILPQSQVRLEWYASRTRNQRDPDALPDFSGIEQRPGLQRSLSCGVVMYADDFRGALEQGECDSAASSTFGDLELQRPRLMRSRSC